MNSKLINGSQAKVPQGANMYSIQSDSRDYDNTHYEDGLIRHSNPDGPKSDEKEYTLYRYRWLVCFFFAAQQMAYGMTMSGYTPVFPYMRKVYDVDEKIIVSLSTMYSPAFI